MELKEPKFEKKEEMPFEADLRVDFIRHGKPSYTKEEFEAGKFEGELTVKGRRQIENQGLELTKNIDKDKELVAIWASPKKRADQTAVIIKDVFEKEGISVWESKTKESLRDLKWTSGSIEFFEKFVKEEGAADAWMKYWSEAEKLPDGVEKPEEVKQRIARVITYLERIARTVQPSGKKLHFICIGHEEIFRDLLEEGFGMGTKKGTGQIYGEVLRIDINKSEDNKDAILNLKYRGMESQLGFNKNSREFHRFKKEN